MRSSGRRGRMWTMFVAATLAVGLMPATVGAAPPAAPDHKSFETTIDPPSITAGTEGAFDLTILNTSSNTDLGSAEIDVPGGFEIVSVGVSEIDWVVVSATDPVRVAAADSASRLGPGEAVVVELAMVTPTQDGDTEYVIDVMAREANNFNGAGNALNGSGPSLLVTGAAVDCASHACSLSLEEGTTKADLTTSCSGPGCGNLVLDLDSSYCDDPGACAGEGAFWLPPVVDENTPVHLTLRIPKSAFDTTNPDGSKKKGKDRQPSFFIAPTGAAAAVLCGSDDDTTGCTYKVFNEKNGYRVEVTVGSVDPRGFVS